MSIRFSDTDIELDQKAILIKHIYEKCKEEYDKNKDLGIHSEMNYEEKVIYLTGCSRDYLNKIITLKGISQHNINICKRVVALIYINYFYNEKKENKELSLNDPTLLEKFYKTMPKTVLEMWNSLMKTDIERYPFEDLLPTYNLLGFTLKNTLNYGLIPIENPLNMFERVRYIKKIRNFRTKGLKIYFIDIRMINTNLNFNKPWISGIDVRSVMFDGCLSLMLASSKKNELNICSHVFFNKLTDGDYKNWISNVVVPILEPSSIVVIDNNPYFNKLHLVPRVSEYSTKKVMLQWLTENQIPCDDSMHRVDLYDLIKRFSNQKDHENDIENIFSAYGHQILKTPVNFDDLTPTGILWNHIREKYNAPNFKKLNKLKPLMNMLSKTLGNLSKHKLKTLMKMSLKFEFTILNVDCLIESELLDIVLI